MSHVVVKILSDDDGYEVEKDDQVWHLSIDEAGGSMSVCTGEYYGAGQSSVVYKVKDVARGGITCTKCLQIIKFYKEIKL